ncbi:MAG: c-type cytochrome [Gemmatimonadales bacterium]|jgi:putative heme-binding domain-containing protein
MHNPWLRVALFTLGLVGMFVWAGEVLSRASGASGSTPLEGVSVANGETIFWGPGKCHTCHAVGPRGRSVRGPDLGASGDVEPLMIRAAARARERSTATGREMTPTDYLVESLVDPGAFVVAGFKDEMPVVVDPPIQLDESELRSVVLYLQTLGGQADPSAIHVSQDVFARRAASESEPWEPPVAGDSARGRALFFDPDGPGRCAGCHRVDDRGADIGPELTHVAGTRTLRAIVESIVRPSATIPAGYETELVQTTDGRILDGLVQRETADSLWLATALGDEQAVAKADIDRRRAQETSLMPEDMADRLTVSQLYDLVAYLRTLE